MKMAKEAGVRLDRLPAVFTAWTQGERAILKRQGRRLFTLTEAYATELAAIIRGGKKSAQGRARRAKSAKGKA